MATKHQKEEVTRPVFEKGLGCSIYVPLQYDMHQFDYRHVIACEGCFGSHPDFYFVPGDTELMAFIDLDIDLIIAEMEISTETNYGHKDIISN